MIRALQMISLCRRTCRHLPVESYQYGPIQMFLLDSWLTSHVTPGGVVGLWLVVESVHVTAGGVFGLWLVAVLVHMTSGGVAGLWLVVPLVHVTSGSVAGLWLVVVLVRRCGSLVIGCSLVVDVTVDMLQCLSECSGSQSETCDAELELWQESRLMVCLVSCISHLLPFTDGFVSFIVVRPGLTWVLLWQIKHRPIKHFCKN